MPDNLPEYFHNIDKEQQFCFSCHPEVDCFTECCRELDLSLSPYDVLRLKNALKMHSGHFLEQYVIVEWDERLVFPQCYLTMVDDGRASCVFVTIDGCSVYPDRPSACRTYPVGRGVKQGNSDTIEECFVLVKEPHCNGFAENTSQTPEKYFTGQGLHEYNHFNDLLAEILQNQRIQTGFRPNRKQLDQYLLALYNLDMFRQEMADGRISLDRPLRSEELQGLAGDDEKLLILGINWLRQELFNNETG